MRFGQRQPDRAVHNETSVLPLINVVFLLLIFFMIAGSWSVTEPFSVEPPHSASEGATENDTLRLLLGKDQQLAIDGRLMSENDLLAEVKQRIAENPELRIALKADAKIAGNRVVLLMEKLREAGVERLYLMTVQAMP